VHSLESGEDASYRYGNLNPVFGNGFPILPQEKSGRWDVHVAAVKAKYCNNKQSTVTSSTKNANDYLCKCGRKCNKTETKCWWCGAPIQ
jgi:restriction endonuclease S subunit